MRKGMAFAAVALQLLSAGWALPTARAQTAETDRRPNIVLILTDDQRWDTLWAMPAVQDRLVSEGVTFDNAFVVNPLCCPSRASILTGNYSHTTQVYRQAPPFGRFDWFDDSSTIATWLDDAGYETAYVGKYVDGYQHAAVTGYVPPGWDHWVSFVHSAYLGYKLTVDGTVRTFANAPSDYSTRVLGDVAVDIVSRTTEPLFLVFAPAAPHAPATPEASHAGAFGDLEPWQPESFNEPDVADKPGYIQDFAPLTSDQIERLEELRRDQYRSLLSVDEQIDRLLDALAAAGRLEDTLIVFTSDNGLAWGEHRWTKKETPYEESIRVPLVIRYDQAGIAARHDDRLALNIDLAPTIVDAASIRAPDMDGRSLVPLLSDESGPWRHAFLIEHMEGTNPIPTYCAVRTEARKYVRYSTGEEELYDLSRDPSELENVASDASSVRPLMEMRLVFELLCVPRPPGLAGSPVWRIGWALLILFGLFGFSVLRTRTDTGRRWSSSAGL